jgi:FHA domain
MSNTDSSNERLPPVEGVAGWFALAPPSELAVLGELLAQLRAAGHPVRGFVDRATLLAAWCEPSPLIVLEQGRQRLSISLASRDDGAASLRRQVSLPGGERALISAWLELVRATLVQQTRFDPLHDKRHEQGLRAELPRLAAEAQRDGQAGTAIDAATGPLALALTRDQFAAAAAPVLQPLAHALQSLAAAHDAATLLVPPALLDVPGIDAILAGAHFARVLRLDPEVTTRALRLLPFEGAAPTGPVPYRTQLPLLTETAPPDALAPVRLRGNEPVTMATHVVYAGRARPLAPAGLVLGRDPGASGLRLPDGIAGLSRCHCTLLRESGRSQIIDHSTHGSWLDGARVRGRALLPAGSTLKLGEPGVELQLVAIAGS